MCQNHRPHDPGHTHSHDHQHLHDRQHKHAHDHEHGHDHSFASFSRRAFVAGLTAALTSRTVLAQVVESKADRWKRQSAEDKKAGLAVPFKGVTTDGNLIPDLFPIKHTGVSTAAVRTAAERFLGTLTAEQRTKVMFPIDDPQWRNWMNEHWYIREGINLQSMSDDQRNAFYALMQVSLSPKGYDLMRNIMRLNETLAEMTDDHVFLGELLYYVTIMGTPSATEPWGWQFQGHHGIVNYFVLGDQVVMTPLFVGGEPVIAESGKYKGTQILEAEQNKGLEFVNSLDASARGKAILKSSKHENINLSEAFKDNLVLDYAGVPVGDLPASRRKELLNLVNLYVGNTDDGHARVRMEEVKDSLSKTYFAWMGTTDPDAVFYYRIHSPVILIEFDHQLPKSLARFFKDPTQCTRKHIHCVVRTPNGNDYGKDLLRQHYLQHSHA